MVKISVDIKVEMVDNIEDNLLDQETISSIRDFRDIEIIDTNDYKAVG